jgi:signal transduction histidine kinase
MKLLRNLRPALRPGKGLGLALLLLLAVAVPSVCLLWFMNQAVRNERLAVRQKLVDAYRGHLSLAQERLEAFWRQTARELDVQAERLPGPDLFAQLVSSGAAEAVLCYDEHGHLTYPTAPTPAPPEATSAAWQEALEWEATAPAAAAETFGHLAAQSPNAETAARALQAEARCLVKAGHKEAALAVLLGPLAEARYREVQDAQGRLLVPNAELMALELLKDGRSNQLHAVLGRLRERLLDYHQNVLPAAQRRFLMHELERRFPGQGGFPTLAAEDLAAQYLEAGASRTNSPVLRLSPLLGVWQFGSEHGRVLALYRTEALLARMRAVVASPLLPADLRVNFLPPGKEYEKYFASTPVGAALPGWRVALSLDESRLFEAAAKQRIAVYVWIGALVVGTVAVLAVLALRLVRRQVALTQLRNDLVANVTHELKTPLSSMRLLVDTLLQADSFKEQTVREYLELIAQENARLSRLIDNFLAFSRMERNKRTFDFQAVPAEQIVQAASTAVRERFNVPGCQFEVCTAPGLPAVSADADAMVTALVNLLDNAYKYSGDEKTIKLSASAVNGHVCFAVEDNGIGLAPRETRRIFKRFYQVDQRLSRITGGCGLGLSIVKFIVTAHRGEVRVESRPNRGSTFTISLPAVKTDTKKEEGA